jgi:hypothetical protein
VIFGSPYSPNEGVLLIPCEDQEAPLICRVMDEDWGTKDDTLGEIVIKSPSTLVDDCTAAGGKITLDLRHKGKEGKGTVTLSATWAATSDGVPKLRIQVFSARSLRSADGMFGKNDVYVQIYPAADMKWNEAKALPEPPKSAILPKGKYTFDLPDLKLPDKLPSTFEISQPRRWKDKAYTHGHVRYYLEASIDIAWNFDPFVRIPFSVSSRLPSSLIAGSVPSSVPQKETYPIAPCCGSCALSCCSPTGVVGMDATLSRNGGAPGEWLVLSGSLTNGTAQERILEVKLTRTTLLSVPHPERHSTTESDLHRYVRHTWTCATLPLSAKEAGAEPAPTQVFVPFEIPTVPASYHGGMLKDDEWEAKIKEIGMAKQATAGNKDPVVWWYDITVSFGVAGAREGFYGDGNTLKVTHPFIVASIPQIVMPTVSMGAILGGPAAPVNAEMVERTLGIKLPRAIPMAACLAVPLDTLAAANDQVVWAGVMLPDGAEGGNKVSCENNFDGNRDGNPCNDLTYQPVFPKVIMPKPEPPEQAVFPV